jgi:hypothetical protein
MVETFAFRIVFTSSEILRHPFSISVFEDWLYWTDWDKNAIYRRSRHCDAHEADPDGGARVPPVPPA